MQMTTCYRYADGTFIAVSSPINTTTANFDSALTNAGYFPQLQMKKISGAIIY